MLTFLSAKLKCLCSRLRWPIRRRSKPKITIKKQGKSRSRTHKQDPIPNGSATVHPNGAKPENPIRIATFNAAQFSMAPVVPQNQKNSPSFDGIEDFSRAKSILSKQQKFAKSKLRVSINLPDNEISLNRSGRLRISEDEIEASSSRIGKGERNCDWLRRTDVKAEEEKGMKPLSDLADALGMNYVFAESWAPEYGNAILSKWPIKKWKVQKIYDDTDFQATIDVPRVGEVNFHCTHLDHLDENWRMKQINTMIQSSDGPHILAGCLNSLDERDYSPERWTDIVKYYEQLGKPTPKVEVMKFLKSKQYADAKAFAGECESVVMIAKGQSVQGTCKYGTRVDYILASSDSQYKFIPGSYSVFSSKGTSDHHIVKVDISKAECSVQQHINRKPRQPKQRIVKITDSSSSKGIWKTHTLDRKRKRGRNHVFISYAL
ncbi:DNAse I-like superfamily protein [Actinidia rufa]|uniref:DNAse I-like superfamily protein n=1 Tax=Actinidia rufa TaxID=165716 RepID=A0A7J0G1K6_9ERIC|nr:DNAse I-like superfamily protein [Actinidia rufa]